MLNKIKTIIESNTSDDILYKKWNTNNRDDFFTKIYWNYAPLTSKYFFEGNPSFFYEYKDMFDMGRYPLTTVRDGFLGVLDFFLVHPKPTKDFQSIIMIPKKFDFLVPPLWKDQVAIYQIDSRDDLKPKKRETLVVYGFAAEELFLNESVEEKIIKLKEKSKGYNQVHFILPQRESLLSSPAKVVGSDYCLELYKHIYKYFGFDTNIYYDVDKFLKEQKIKDFSFINLDDDNVFISDDFFAHYLFGLNGQQLVQNTVPSKNEGEFLSYNLSFYHKIKISDWNPSVSQFNQYFVPFKMSRRNSSIYELFNFEEIRTLYINHN